MKTIFWTILACSGMRYSSCATVDLGELCEEEQLGMLECTERPPMIIDDSCYEYVTEDHDVAQCTETEGSYIWTYYDSCSSGLYATTNGVDFECKKGSVWDCHGTEESEVGY